MKDGVITGGMIPKIETAWQALDGRRRGGGHPGRAAASRPADGDVHRPRRRHADLRPSARAARRRSSPTSARQPAPQRLMAGERRPRHVGSGCSTSTTPSIRPRPPSWPRSRADDGLRRARVASASTTIAGGAAEALSARARHDAWPGLMAHHGVDPEALPRLGARHLAGPARARSGAGRGARAAARPQVHLHQRRRRHAARVMDKLGVAQHFEASSTSPPPTMCPSRSRRPLNA